MALTRIALTDIPPPPITFVRDPLSRQLDEAVRIGMVEGHRKVLGDRSEGVGGSTFVLNRKDEHYEPKVVHYNFYTQTNKTDVTASELSFALVLVYE